MATFGFIGTGNMGGAIAKAVCRLWQSVNIGVVKR
jgi:predicted dinucleotide-binding enzyme